MSEARGLKGVPFPDDGMLFMESSAADMLANGLRLMNFVKDHGHLNLEGTVVDVGCGYGRNAYALLDMGFEGRYLGFDILSDHIRWLSDNFQSNSTGALFEFEHLDVINDRYNPRGRFEATEALLPEMGEPADLIIAFSVFTHMYPVEVMHYLRELSFQMNGDSILCASFFLMNADWEVWERRGGSTFPMPYSLDDSCSYSDPEDPLYAIAFRDDWLDSTFAEAGLARVGKTHLGSWCGRGRTRPCFQDTVFLRRASASAI